MAQPERWPFVIVAPQKPVGNAEWEDYEDAVFEMLDLAVESFGADDERVAITGLSQGGHGTIAIASSHPERFVAAAPVCGYVERWNPAGSRKRVAATADSPVIASAADGLAELAVWLFHGDRDEVVQQGETIESLRRAIDASPHDVYAHLSLAEVLTAQQKSEAAEFALRRAIQLEPGDTRFLAHVHRLGGSRGA